MFAEGNLDPQGKLIRSPPERDKWVADTHVVGAGVPKDVIERLCLGHVLGRLSDDDGQLDLIVGEMHVDWLGDLGNTDRSIRSDHGREGFVEQKRCAGMKGMKVAV